MQLPASPPTTTPARAAANCSRSDRHDRSQTRLRLPARAVPPGRADQRPVSIPDLRALTERFQYALQFGAISVITGEVGSGKSTSLRHVTSTLQRGYLAHHLQLAAGNATPPRSPDLLSDAAVTAIHQGSGGLLRRANHLARGALVAAARESCSQVAAEHVRLAATEIL